MTNIVNNKHQNSQPILPLLGFGTWGLFGKKCEKAVRDAIEIGYRSIDTALAYENHKDIARAMKGFPRNELFLTSKINIGPATQTYTASFIDDQNIESSVERACDRILEELSTDYLDSLLLHWPDRKQPMLAIYQAMEALIGKGKVRYVGVSNFTIHHIQDLIDSGCTISLNQVEFHPYLNQKELYAYSQKMGIQLISYRPFGKGKLLKEEPAFARLGKKYGKSAAQVILRWLIQKNIAVIPKAASAKHRRENFAIQDFFLTPKEMDFLESFNKSIRYCSPDWADFSY